MKSIAERFDKRFNDDNSNKSKNWTGDVFLEVLTWLREQPENELAYENERLKEDMKSLEKYQFCGKENCKIFDDA